MFSMRLNATACTLFVLLAGQPCLAADSGSSAGPNVQAGSPQRLYEAVSGYMEGYRQKERSYSSKQTGKKEQRRDPRLMVRKDYPIAEAHEIDHDLARARLARHEWDMAVPALQRAIKTARASGASELAYRLDQNLQQASAKTRDPVQERPPTPGEYANTVGMRIIAVPGGTFNMGSPEAELRRIQGEWPIEEALIRPEEPVHSVRITQPYGLGKYEVTVAQFRRFVDDSGYRSVAEKQGWGWVYDERQNLWVKKAGASWRNPGHEQNEDYPVTMICHQDAEAFCAWLGRKENRRYYLPTEAQWEHAARSAKESQRYPWGDQYPDGKKLNIADRRSGLPWADRTLDDGYARTAPVGSYEPNGLWLYDMMGNVWELCYDHYDDKLYEKSKDVTSSDPLGPSSGKKRVVRGGNWAFGAGIARNAFRFAADPDLCTDMSGFRVAVELLPQEKPGEQSAARDLMANEQLNRQLDKVRNLISSGRRIEARHLAEDLYLKSSKSGRCPEDCPAFVRDVFETLIDLAKDKTMESFRNSIGINMVRIPAGSFIMGSSETDIAWAMGTLAQGQPISLENEFPFHKVRLTRPFLIGATEVTVGQFRRFVEETGYVTDAEADNSGQVFNEERNQFERKAGSSWKNPGWTIADDQPVTMVSYDDAQAFVEWLTAKEKLPYKLPTEAQWEYACRGGLSTAHFPWGDEAPDGRRANYADKSTNYEWRDRNADDGYKFVAPVASYEPNGYGLYDMAGNVLEWVRDFYGEDYYRFAPEVDPEGIGHGENRVMKGGEWTFGPANLRCAFRGWARPEMSFFNSGFRVSIELSSPLRPFHFSNDFLTRAWVPGTDQRTVTTATAAEKDRAARVKPPESEKPKPAVPPAYENLVKGVAILGFTPKSDAKKARMAKGDVIIEYNGERELTAEKFLALTGQTKRDKIRPLVVFVRDGYEYSMRITPGFLGITVMDTTVKGPFRKWEEQPQREPTDDSQRKSKGQDWT